MQALTQSSPYAHLRSLPHNAAQITAGFWASRQARNREITLHHGYKQLHTAGNYDNLRRAAGQLQGEYQGPLFMDSDLYKWLEAVAWELGRKPDALMAGWLDEAAELLALAQQPDGYLNSYFTYAAPEKRWQDLDHGHELYCAGHLIQAAIAAHRTTGKTHLLAIACRFADHIDATFGPGKQNGYCGHPEIEMALVELARETGEKRYAELAQVMIDRRGQNKMRGFRWAGSEYMQDRTPVREATQVEGHAVRQIYLNAGVTDLYLETGEKALLSAMEAQWHDAVHHKMHLIGGYGARFEGEAFGNAYELPSDQCYCETCAAIAAMMWNWRMLLATGDPRYADTLERSLYNNFLSGISLEGDRYFYINPLLSQGGVERHPWFGCACCPPNIMRQLSALDQYIATQDDQGIQLHQYMTSNVKTGAAALSISTDYPWEGAVRITVEASQAQPWKLSLRIPAWAAGAVLTINHERSSPQPTRPGTYAQIERVWKAGDEVELFLPLRPRLTAANPRADALRGSLAIERGPLVYCVEAADQPAGLQLLDTGLLPNSPLEDVWRPDLLGGVITVEAQGALAEQTLWEDELYLPAAETTRPPVKRLRLIAVPYYTWANRGAGAMRVWLPRMG